MRKYYWDTTPYVVLWRIWNTRNDIVFKDKQLNVNDTVDLIKLKMAFWVKGKYNLNSYSIEDFRSHLDGIRRHKI
ncbi:hypothetical protein RHMOL_Rhmol02G0051600 [Rhododendron molle]|uniref:Uncharacterized protein n=1 Tax=Rhododendron molle TaxID=49168 RepID=A0ACC0PN73_RHOML|nr:hypothetical protein RHMOL_Rhmol02G0051600 [Rhododendron molle]